MNNSYGEVNSNSGHLKLNGELGKGPNVGNVSISQVREESSNFIVMSDISFMMLLVDAADKNSDIKEMLWRVCCEAGLIEKRDEFVYKAARLHNLLSIIYDVIPDDHPLRANILKELELK